MDGNSVLQRSSLRLLLLVFLFSSSRARPEMHEDRERVLNRAKTEAAERSRKPEKGKKRHQVRVDGASLSLSSPCPFFYLEKRVQPFDLDHPPVAREVGPVAGGAVAGGGRLPWRWSGGHRGREDEE